MKDLAPPATDVPDNRSQHRGPLPHAGAAPNRKGKTSLEDRIQAIKQRILRTILREFLKRYGYRLIRLPGDQEYDNVFPTAKYSPWNLDTEFLKAYDSIRRHTLVDIYRCWELWSLVEQATKLSEGAMLEVGVWRGGTAALLGRRAARLGMNDPVYLCDTFMGVVKAGDRDSLYKGGEHEDATMEEVEALLASLGISQARILKGIFPDETAQFIPPETTFRLIHIDVDVYQSAKDVLAWGWERLVRGGMVVFDDYGDIGTTGVQQLVNESIRQPDRLVLHNLNGHAILIKIA